MTSRTVWRAASFAAGIVLLAACGKATAPSRVPEPVPVPATPIPQFSVATRCFGPFHPGTYYGLACVAELSHTDPRVAAYSVHADLRVLGGAQDLGFPKCPACGDPPTFDIDLRIPADMTPGVKTFPVWATDTEGRRADTTATIEIVR